MLELSIFSVFYIADMALTILVLTRIDWRRPRFCDGILLGVIYFLAAPLLLIVFSGGFTIDELNMPSYVPLKDFNTTILILLGWLLVACYVACRTPLKATTRQQFDGILPKQYPLYILLAGLLTCEVLFFMMSGKASGGHWSEGAGQAFQGNFLAILVASFNNAFRAMFFGAIVWFSGAGIITKKRCSVLGLIVCLADTFMTFNRVTFAYYAISMFLIYRHQWKLILLFGPPMVVLMQFLSKLWVTMRGLAMLYGYSAHGFAMALDDALFSHKTGVSETIAAASNTVFETSNLAVLNYIVSTVGKTVDPLWGWTLVLRPITLFLPSLIWQSKPITYGLILGDEQMHIPGLALNSTLLGEPYGNFYLFWPLALLAVIAVYDYLFGLFAVKRPYISAMAFMAGFAVCRFEVTFLSTCLLAIGVFVISLKFANIIYTGHMKRQTKRLHPLPGSRELRYQYLTEKFYQYGYFRSTDLYVRFGIPMVQARREIREWLRVHEDEVRFSKLRKRYERIEPKAF